MILGWSVIFAFIHTATAQDSCRITSGLRKACIFPYRFNGKTYSECTTNRPGYSSEPVCPTRLTDRQTLEASENPDDWGQCSTGCPLHSYSSNQGMFDEIVELGQQFPTLAQPFTIGFSTQGVELVGIRISRSVRRGRKELKPMVRLVGNIHGNEVVGREVLLHLARHLLTGYNVVSIGLFL